MPERRSVSKIHKEKGGGYENSTSKSQKTESHEKKIQGRPHKKIANRQQTKRKKWLKAPTSKASKKPETPQGALSNGLFRLIWQGGGQGKIVGGWCPVLKQESVL